jgi:hypothetical protein
VAVEPFDYAWQSAFAARIHDLDTISNSVARPYPTSKEQTKMLEAQRPNLRALKVGNSRRLAVDRLDHASCNSNSCVTDDSVRVGQGKTTV